MARRRADTILAEWRTLERALGDSSDAEERIDLERAVAGLADEYREAVEEAERDGPLDELADRPPGPPASDPAPAS